MSYKDKAKQKAAQAKHYQDNKATYRNRLKKRRCDLKEWSREYNSSCKCSQCGEKDSRCLDFHHFGNKEFGITDAVRSALSKYKILKELNNCEVLCSNCHRIKHSEAWCSGNTSDCRSDNTGSIPVVFANRWQRASQYVNSI